MMTHAYTCRKYHKPRFKILCSKQWVDGRPTKQTWRKEPETYVMVTTSPSKVTCPKCLEIIIPREEAKLEKLKITYRDNI